MVKKSKDAHKLIEEFMLLANKKVAEFIGKPRKNHTPPTSVYRIHDLPDPAKIEQLKVFLDKFKNASEMQQKIRREGLEFKLNPDGTVTLKSKKKENKMTYHPIEKKFK
jgi:exoribonuclease R